MMININKIKNAFSVFYTRLKDIKYTDFIMCVLISFAMTFTLEALGRHSVPLAFSFMIYHAGFFVSNFSIILCTVTLCLFFKRRYFALSLVLLLWLALGVTNCIILTYRNTPLAAVDFSIVKSALDIMNSYVKPIQIISICSMVVVAIVVIVLVLKYAPRVTPNFASASVYMATSVIVCFVAMAFSYSIYSDPECFANLPEAYKNYGFAYSFSCSAVNRGVDKPEDYSEESVKNIIEKIDSEKVGKPKVMPNMVFVQLESFFDVKYMKDLEYNMDPIPVYTKLKEENSSGFLRIPGLGGGTCNAEFEVLTGMSVGMFGTCEYPYKTITLNHTASSLSYDLKKLGYSTHAVHNHTGTFYDRHRNYANLGFDRFIPVEYMHDVERNANNWAKDKILTGEIFKCLNSTEGRDFVYGVSVQSHGKYPKEVIEENQPVVVTKGLENDPEYKIGYEYFINQLHEMDMFVGELVEAIKKFDEPTVLVLYGDHLPAMSISKEQLVNEDLFQTEYVVWANFEIPKNDEDLYAYQLTSRVTETLGIEGSYVNKLHRYYKNDKDNPQYEKDLQTLMYDELYGGNFAYGGTSPFNPTDIVYGIEPFYIEGASVGSTATTLKGTGFTEKSKVFVDDVLVSATYVDTNTLMLSKTVAKVGDEIYVAQRCSDKHVLGKTDVYTITENDIIQ
jgi:phosphoglycerol transferase MdoB-like AlkP superfamily enzyme